MTEFRQKLNRIQSSTTFVNGRLYLIEAIDNTSGFLLGGEKLYFVLKNNGGDEDSISTTYLSLRTNLHINTIENSPSFEPGYYDVLIYNISLDDSYLDSFVELCKMYVNSSTGISFGDFFYALLKLFEPSKETSFSNLVGMFGELFFMKKMFNDFGVCLADQWHNSSGPNDKYDFSCENANIEIKTTSKVEMVFSLKHSQIFNDSRNYIIVINIDLDNSGISVSDLYDFFRETKPFDNNLDFAIKLEKEKKKVSPLDFVVKKFSVSKLNIFLNSKLDTISGIPDCIDSISYSYDFIGKESVAIEDLVKDIK